MSQEFQEIWDLFKTGEIVRSLNEEKSQKKFLKNFFECID